MSNLIKISFFAMCSVLFFCLPVVGISRNSVQQKDSSRSAIQNQDSSVTKSGLKIVGSEIELEEIRIQAVMEKPMVAIVAKRMEPRFIEMEFINRSFERELKSVPVAPLIEDDRLLIPQKISKFIDKHSPKKTKKKNNYY